MKEALFQTRSMNLLYHDFHNKVGRIPFEGDHELFNEWYTSLEDDYDNIAERLIGLSDSNAFSLKEELVAVSSKINSLPTDYKENTQMFQIALQLENELKTIIEGYAKSGQYSQGTLNMLAQIADNSEMRTYKIKRRLVK